MAMIESHNQPCGVAYQPILIPHRMEEVLRGTLDSLYLTSEVSETGVEIYFSFIELSVQSILTELP